MLAEIRPRWRVATPIAAGFLTALFAMKEDGAIDDLAASASGIDRQQVALGQWAKSNIPEGARIGVNDTGAIAYFGDHPTFDIVGLTTPGEGRYWVAGQASRFEHYELLYREAPASLPRYFIVYPEWMACDAVLGTRLFDVTVTDSSILGGQTMAVYEADYSRLGSGELPWTRIGPVVDALDVADLESEAAHGYELLGAEDGEEIITTQASPEGATVIDGGRRERHRERFRVSGEVTRGVVRFAATEATRVQVIVNGRTVSSFAASAGAWSEAKFALPARGKTGATVVELVPDGGTLTTYHYWFDAS